MVPDGERLVADASDGGSLDPGGPARIVWRRMVDGSRVVVLLGAFDPPTVAHLAILDAASRSVGTPGAFGMTTVLLDRPSDELLDRDDRIRILDDIAERCGSGFLMANRGTYLEVHRALASEGMDPTFVVGSDKLVQVSDASFYPDGERGVASTFAEVRFVVIPRPGSSVNRDDVRVLDASEVFADPSHAALSASEVRRRARSGEPIDGLVPPEVAVGIGGYTADQ